MFGHVIVNFFLFREVKKYILLTKYDTYLSIIHSIDSCERKVKKMKDDKPYFIIFV